MLIDSSDISKTKASFINVFFNYGSTVVLIINSILLVPFYLKFMTLSDYGAWLSAVALINVVMILDPGISSISSQQLSKSFNQGSDKNFQKHFCSTLLVSLIFAFFIFFGGINLLPYVISTLNFSNVPLQSELMNALILYVLAIGLGTISSVLSSFFQALLRTFTDNLINFICILSSPIVIVISLLNGLGLISLALGVLLPNLLRVTIFSSVITYSWAKVLEQRFWDLKNISFLYLFKDIRFLYLRKFSSITSENLETAVAGVFFTTEIAAFVSILKRLFISIQMFSTGIATSTYTSLSHAFADRNKNKLMNAIRKTIYTFHLVHLFGTTVILASIGSIIYIWLGKELFFSFDFILLMAFNIFLIAKITLFNSILYSSGDYKSVAYVSIVEAVFRILFTYFLLNLIDIYGLPIAGILASFVGLFFLIRLVKSTTGHAVVELIFPSSYYEVLVYLFALLLGYFNTVQENLFYDSLNLIVITLGLSLLILLSKKVRDLIKVLINALR